MTLRTSHCTVQEWLARNEFENALKAAGPILERHPDDLLAWYQLTRALCGLTTAENEQKNLDAVIRAFVASGTPLLALLALLECPIDTVQTNTHLKTLLKQCEIPSTVPTSPIPPWGQNQPNIPPWSDDLDLDTAIQMAQSLSAISWGNSLSVASQPPPERPLPWFDSLMESSVRSFFEQLKPITFLDGEKIVARHSSCTTLLLLLNGRCEEQPMPPANDQPRHASLPPRRILPGEIIGEAESVLETPFQHDVVATECCSFASIELANIADRCRTDSRFLDRHTLRAQKTMLTRLMHNALFLQPLSFSERATVLKQWRPAFFSRGSKIIAPSSDPVVCMLVAGAASVNTSQTQESEHSIQQTGELFGWLAPEETDFPVHMHAIENTLVIKLSQNEFRAILQSYSQLDTVLMDAVANQKKKLNRATE
ncbi:MAG: cyclic nucleotide-binding domain-containing protein [Deltaproteobacteria bacterium]|nr:cyclic nucleotide-binding domain-containing protein [Deltaproteobacteria bacterium]MBN2673958.1 cyclic nucleotide-binding domain-containing protein [Deltaproteobacteria bacterium]